MRPKCRTFRVMSTSSGEEHRPGDEQVRGGQAHSGCCQCGSPFTGQRRCLARQWGNVHLVDKQFEGFPAGAGGFAEAEFVRRDRADRQHTRPRRLPNAAVGGRAVLHEVDHAVSVGED
jgi:hypothetical protein